ncbi:MAG: beta-ribofuranosylaminobenzene 5'-phosphate synthase family protein [Methylocystis sp.]
MSAQVSVTAAARLHLGFLDMNGGLGRKFGGIGLALDSPATIISLKPALKNSANGPETERARRLLSITQEVLAPSSHFQLTVHHAIPAHSGLGSGTQLALAIAAALRSLENLPLNSAADAAMLSRGARSGLGAGLFEQGGFVVDGGRGASTLTPPVISRTPFPQEWRAILVHDPEAVGLHDSEEKEAFAALAPLSPAASGEICRLVLMQLMPALAENEFAPFSAALTRIQEIVGDYFSPAQKNSRYTSKKVERLIMRLGELGAAGLGQTSWGPTGFAFTESEISARIILEQTADEVRSLGLTTTLHRGLNTGAKIEQSFAQIA